MHGWVEVETNIILGLANKESNTDMRVLTREIPKEEGCRRPMERL